MFTPEQISKIQAIHASGAVATKSFEQLADDLGCSLQSMLRWISQNMHILQGYDAATMVKEAANPPLQTITPLQLEVGVSQTICNPSQPLGSQNNETEYKERKMSANSITTSEDTVDTPKGLVSTQSRGTFTEGDLMILHRAQRAGINCKNGDACNVLAAIIETDTPTIQHVKREMVLE